RESPAPSTTKRRKRQRRRRSGSTAATGGTTKPARKADKRGRAPDFPRRGRPARVFERAVAPLRDVRRARPRENCTPCGGSLPRGRLRNPVFCPERKDCE